MADLLPRPAYRDPWEDYGQSLHDVVLEDQARITAVEARVTAIENAAPGAITLTPSTEITGGEITQRTNFNNALIADADNAFDLVVDLTGNATFEDTGSAYYVDGTHFTDTGGQALAAIAQPQILALLA